MTLTAGVCDGALKRAWGSETWQWHICAGAIRGAQKSATKALKGALKIRPPAVAGKNPNYTDTCGNTQNLPPVSLDFRVPNGTPTSTKDTHDKLPCGLSRGVPPRSLPRGFRIKIARIKTVSKPYQTCIKPVSNRIKPYQTVSVSVPWSDCLALTAFTLPTSGLVIDLAA